MINSHLIKTLKILREKDLKELDLFLKSPYHNTNSNASRLFNILKEEYPSFNNVKKLSKEKVFQKLFGRSVPFNKNKLHIIMHHLNKLVKDFLGHEALKNNELHKKIFYLEYVAQSDIHHQLIEEIKTFIQEIKEKPILNENHHLLLCKLLLKLQSQPNTNRYHANLEEPILHLYFHFLINWIRLYAEQLNKNKILKKETKLLGQDQILHVIENSKVIHSPSILSFLAISKLHLNKMDYFDVKDIIFSNWGQLEEELKKDLILHLINVAIQKNRNGTHSFMAELWELYLVGLDEKLLITNNRISDIMFVNITSTAAGLFKLDWAESFKKKYNKYLEPSKRVNALQLASAYIYFFKAKHENAPSYYIDCINELSVMGRITMERFTLRAHCLRIRAAFEQYLASNLSSEKFDSALESFSRFLYRQDNLNHEPYFRMIKVLKQLKSLNKVGLKKKDKKEDQKRINFEFEKGLPFSNWFEEKIGALSE